MDQLLSFTYTSDNDRNDKIIYIPLYAGIQTAIEYLSLNYHSDISLEHIAKTVGYSKYHLLREFKKITGYTPQQYISAVRLNKIKQLLIQENELTIRDLTYTIGYYSLGSFTNQFTKITGYTPKSYRKNFQYQKQEEEIPSPSTSIHSLEHYCVISYTKNLLLKPLSVTKLPSKKLHLENINLPKMTDDKISVRIVALKLGQTLDSNPEYIGKLEIFNSLPSPKKNPITPFPTGMGPPNRLGPHRSHRTHSIILRQFSS